MELFVLHLSATIGTGNIVGVATAFCRWTGSIFLDDLQHSLGMATKYSEGLLAVKYRTIDEDGHVLGGPFYYIENGMGKKWRWLAKIFAFFGAGVGLFGIGTFTQVNGISSAVRNFFDPDMAHTVALFGNDYSWATVISCLVLDSMCRNCCIRWNQENCKGISDHRSVHGGSLCCIGSLIM